MSMHVPQIVADEADDVSDVLKRALPDHAAQCLLLVLQPRHVGQCCQELVHLPQRSNACCDADNCLHRPV